MVSGSSGDHRRSVARTVAKRPRRTSAGVARARWTGAADQSDGCTERVGVVEIVAGISEKIRRPHDERLAREMTEGAPLCEDAPRFPLRVLEDPVADLGRKVEPGLELGDHAYAMSGMMEAAGYERRESSLAGVTERRVPDVVAEGDRVDQRIDETERSSQLPGDGADLECVGEPGTNVRVAWNREDLRLAGQPTKSPRPLHPVPVTPVSFSI